MYLPPGVVSAASAWVTTAIDSLAGDSNLIPDLRAVGRGGQAVVERLDGGRVVQRRRDVVGEHPLQRRTHPAARRVRAVDGGEAEAHLRVELGDHRLDRHLEVVPGRVGHVGADGVAGGAREAVEHAAGAIDEQVDRRDLRYEHELGRLAGGVGARVADRRPTGCKGNRPSRVRRRSRGTAVAGVPPVPGLPPVATIPPVAGRRRRSQVEPPDRSAARRRRTAGTGRATGAIRAAAATGGGRAASSSAAESAERDK